MNHLFSRLLLLPLFVLLFTSAAVAADSGLIKINTKSTPTATLANLKKLIEQKGYTIFSVTDHGDEDSVKQVIAFGKEKNHARIMWHDAAVGLDLPLKIAVIQDDTGVAQVVYRKPTSLRNTYDVQHCRLLDKLDWVMADLAQVATQ